MPAHLARLSVLTAFMNKRFLRNKLILLIILILGACQAEEKTWVGNYEAFYQAEDDSRHLLRLELMEDQRASFSSDPLEGGESILQRGSWEKKGNQVLMVYLVEKDSYFFLDTLQLSPINNRLLLIRQASSDISQTELLKSK